MFLKVLFLLPFLSCGAYIVYAQNKASNIHAYQKRKLNNKLVIEMKNNISDKTTTSPAIQAPKTTPPSPLVTFQSLKEKQSNIQTSLNNNLNTTITNLITSYTTFKTEQETQMKTKKTAIEQQWTDEETRLKNLKQELETQKTQLTTKVNTLKQEIKSITDAVDKEVLDKFNPTSPSP